MKVLTGALANDLLGTIGLEIGTGGRIGHIGLPTPPFVQMLAPPNYIERMFLPEKILDWFHVGGRWKLLSISDYSFFWVSDAIILNSLVGSELIGAGGRAQCRLLFERSDDPKEEFRSNVILSYICNAITDLGQHAQVASDGCHGDVAGFEDGYVQLISPDKDRLDLAKRLLDLSRATPNSRANWYMDSVAAEW